jgi:ComEC/Rec2-related protein
LFVSGLGHVLSISGYHMAVVAGVVYFAIRALLALSPALRSRYAIKKWAALAALIAALFYLLLSGAEVATQRSFYMTALVLVAVMADRRAITFRTLALAAMLVLLLAPEALVHPSFQMSFAATLGLVVLAQIGMPQWFSTRDDTAFVRRRARDHALRSVSLPPHRALRRHRQSGRDAGGVGAGDAGGASRDPGHSIRVRQSVLAPDGNRHRLDDRGGAMGGGIAGRVRPRSRF